VTTPRGSVFGDDLGGVGRQTGGAPIPNIGGGTAPVSDESPGPVTADGYPVSPYIAARRYGAAAGQGYGGDGDPGSP
jgi:hypothetical protein